MERVPVRRAWCWLALLGLLFFAVYGACNAYTAGRSDIGVVAWAWESHIPFIPWLILPYWAIDILFIGSVFRCRTPDALDRHAWRIVLAILFSAVGFLLWPLRCGFERTEVHGLLAPLFRALYTFDQPYNQAPSLHISLVLILWPRYAALFFGWRRWLAMTGFFLIGISTLGIHQHQVVDVISGLWVGILCLYLVPDRGWQRWGFVPDAASRRIARRYLAGAAGFMLCAILMHGWGWLLLWPAASLLMVAAGYGKFGPAVFQKSENGLQSVSARWLLAPYRGGAWLSARWLLRRLPESVEIVPGLVVGGLNMQRRNHACLDFTAEFQQPTEAAFPVLDLTPPPPEVLRAALHRIETYRKTGQPVCLCCALGLSRSATVAAAWLVRHGGLPDAHAAFQFILQRHPAIVWNDAHETAVTVATHENHEAGFMAVSRP